MPKLFEIRTERRPDGSLAVSVLFTPTLASLPRIEQEREIERALWVASEAVKTATDPIIEQELRPLLAALDERRASNAA